MVIIKYFDYLVARHRRGAVYCTKIQGTCIIYYYTAGSSHWICLAYGPEEKGAG